MALLLYINGQLADLDAGTVIAQTKQVNDLNSLDNRQANYTNKFRLPKTAHNMRLMQFLTLPGNTSGVPYQKNECSLYSHTGECFVYKGWAVVTDGGDSYDAVVYDGIIDLYKNIENETLANLNLQDIQHTKTVANVVSSWTGNLPYRYILADYNGDTGLTNITPGNVTPQVNIDYLVPSVKVSWLWEKIFQHYNNGVQPTGSVFNTQDFKGLYMTFPKGQVREAQNTQLVFSSENYIFPYNRLNQETNHYYAKFTTATVNTIAATYNNIHLKVAQSASYRLSIKGKLHGHKRNGTEARDSCIRIGKNCENRDSLYAGFQGGQLLVNGQKIFGEAAESFPFGADIDLVSIPFQLSAYDSICVTVSRSETTMPGRSYALDEANPANELEVTLQRIDPNNIDFSTVFTDFPVKDFLNEVVHRFGLTLFKEKYSSSYTFLTLQEQLQTPHTVNWSTKFSRKISENYIHGNYAQNNWFRYSYNDKESTHNDGCIPVSNVNIGDSRDVIKSKIYSPERVPSFYLGQNTHVYKLWDKEAVENPEPGASAVTYKPLDKRYYFMKALPDDGYNITVTSPELGTQATVGSYFRESYMGLKFPEIINTYYSPLQSIVKKAMTVTAELWLTDADIVNFDFKKLYYIEQLSSYFIVNKINNYIPGKVTKCDLIRVVYAEAEPKAIYVSNNILRQYVWPSYVITIPYSINYSAQNLIIERSTNLSVWIEVDPDDVIDTESPAGIYSSSYPPNTYYFRIRDIDNNIISNHQSLIIP